MSGGACVQQAMESIGGRKRGAGPSGDETRASNTCSSYWKRSSLGNFSHYFIKVSVPSLVADLPVAWRLPWVGTRARPEILATRQRSSRGHFH